MGSDAGGAGIQWADTLTNAGATLVAALIAVAVAVWLSRRERKAAESARRDDFVLHHYSQIYDALASASEKVTAASKAYERMDSGWSRLDSATDDLRTAYGIAIALDSPKQPEVGRVLGKLTDWLSKQPSNWGLGKADQAKLELNAFARELKDLEIGVLRHMVSEDYAKDVNAAHTQATKDSDESSADGNDAKSSS